MSGHGLAIVIAVVLVGVTVALAALLFAYVGTRLGRGDPRLAGAPYREIRQRAFGRGAGAAGRPGAPERASAPVAATASR